MLWFGLICIDVLEDFMFRRITAFCPLVKTDQSLGIISDGVLKCFHFLLQSVYGLMCRKNSL